MKAMDPIHEQIVRIILHKLLKLKCITLLYESQYEEKDFYILPKNRHTVDDLVRLMIINGDDRLDVDNYEILIDDLFRNIEEKKRESFH